MLSQTFRRFDDGDTVTALGYDIVIRRRNAGHLELPSGELVACDPLTFLDTEPFAIEVEPGSYPVLLFVAELRDDTQLAYAMLEISREPTVRWRRARVQGDEETSLLDLPDAGFPVESSIAAFMDAHTAGVLMNYTQTADDDEFPRALHGALARQRKQGGNWANLNLRRNLNLAIAEDLNIIAFEAGSGTELYESWIGLDEADEITRVVTDFRVLNLHFNTFRL